MTECLLRRGVCFNGRLKMQCLQVLPGSMTECLLRRSEVSAYGRLKMQCLYCETMTECPLR